MIFNLVRIIIDVVHLTTVGMCGDVEYHLPWTVNHESLVFTHQDGNVCSISYRALDIPLWAIEWSVSNTIQLYWDEQTVTLRSVYNE